MHVTQQHAFIVFLGDRSGPVDDWSGKYAPSSYLLNGVARRHERALVMEKASPILPSLEELLRVPLDDLAGPLGSAILVVILAKLDEESL